MSRRKCFLVCNAHLDPVWLWHWEDGLTEAISTFRVAADFCEQYERFVFNHNEALLYEGVERNDPELFARIQRLVAAGKWHVAGGAYLQPDMIAATGESMIRQYLVGKGYFQEKFGVEPTTAYNFDSFGHPQGMIQVLAGCGADSYVFCRPGRGQMPLPIGAFRWQHASGAEVFARRSDDHYITQGEIGRSLPDFLPIAEPEGDFMFLWGLGNHGGGPSHAEYADLQRVIAEHPEVEFIESTPEDFFAHTLAVRGRDLPVVHGDLTPVSPGCYTSMQRVKTKHRQLENLILTTEKLAARAWWQGKRAYPAAELLTAWKDILFCEFHDILPGSGIPRVEEDALTTLAHAEEILRRQKVETLISLLREEPLAERTDTPIFVFNPHSWEVTQEVEVEYCLDRQYGPDSVVRTLALHGRPLPAQFEKAQHNLDDPGWGEWRPNAVFTLTVPPGAYRRVDASYTVLPPEQVRRWKTPALPKTKTLTVATAEMTVKVNLQTGLLDRVQVGDDVVLGRGSCQPQVFNDLNDSWQTPPEWRAPLGLFRLATPPEAARIMNSDYVYGDLEAGRSPLNIIEDGPIRMKVEAIFVYNHSYLVQRYVIYKTRPVVQVEQTIFWDEHDKLLKLELRHDRRLSQLQAEKCYSLDDAMTARILRGEESDYQHFLRLTAPEGDLAFAVLGHGTHGYSHKNATLRLSILRSPSYGTMSISPECDRYRNRYIPRHDQGIRQNKFTLVFGAPAASPDALTRLAYEYNMPLEALVYFPTKKEMPPVTPDAFLAVSPANVLVTAMKQAESGEALVLRLWETAGRNTAYAVKLSGNVIYKGRLGAHQLRTLRLDRHGHVVETDLLERPAEPSRPGPRK